MNQFVLLILFLFATAFLLGLDLVFYIAYVCLGIFAWSRWGVPWLFKQLVVRRTLSDPPLLADPSLVSGPAQESGHAFLGETVPVTLTVENPSWLRLPWVQLQETIAIELQSGKPLKWVLSPKRGETAVYSYTVRAMKRGYYRLGPLQLTTGDLFGLGREQRAYIPAQYLTVYPRLIPLAQLGLPSRLPFGTIASRQRLFEDPARPMGVRDYRSGDSLRQINWKASGHGRNLVVKTLQPAISLETAVLLNLCREDYQRQNRYDTQEWAIVVAASLAAHLINQRQPVGLITNGIDPLAADENTFDDHSGRLYHATGQAMVIPPAILPRNGRLQLMKILERLARLESNEQMPFNQWAGTACLPLSWGITILAITPQGDEATCQTLHRLVRAGYNPVLITLEPSGQFGLVRNRAQRLGFRAYQVANERDLNRWQQPAGILP